MHACAGVSKVAHCCQGGCWLSVSGGLVVCSSDNAPMHTVEELRQVGGGPKRGRPKMITATPKGVKKSEPKMSGSGYHVRTRYRKGDIDGELCEKVVKEHMTLQERQEVAMLNHRARKYLFAEFNDADEKQELGPPSIKLPEGVSCSSRPTPSANGRKWQYVLVGFDLTCNLDLEIAQQSWSQKEVKAMQKCVTLAGKELCG